MRDAVSARLSARHLQVALLLAEGLRASEIAMLLGVSERQVRRLLAEAVERLAVRGTVELVAAVSLTEPDSHGLPSAPSPFADFEELAARCRFSNCQHNGEPGCAVRAEGDPERVAAWQKLKREQKRIQKRIENPPAANAARDRVRRRVARRAKTER